MLSQINKIWPIVVVVSSIIAGYATLRANVVSVKEITEKHIYKIENHETRVSKLEEAISQVPEIRQDVKQILKEMRR